MADYDDIGVPVGGQPISSTNFGIKVRNAIIDLGKRVGIREAAENLPANVANTAGSGGGNVMATAANVWGPLPTNPVTAVITNPSTQFNLVVDVHYGAWMSVSTGDVRLGVALSGGMTVAPGPGANQPNGWGMVPLTTVSTTNQRAAYFQVVIPPGLGAVTFTMQGFRSSGSATNAINYASIYLVPTRYTVP